MPQQRSCSFKESIVDIVRNYIPPCEYKKCLFINKEWNTIFSVTKHLAQLEYKLRYGGWTTIFTKNFIENQEISTLELLKCLIETLETNKRTYHFTHTRYKMIIPNQIKRNPRLKFINLDGM